jgi:hypothetical protein
MQSGEKTFEVRKDDRGFHAGDELLLREYNPSTCSYTGAELQYTITYVLTGMGIKPGFVVLGIKPPTPAPALREAVELKYGTGEFREVFLFLRDNSNPELLDLYKRMEKIIEAALSQKVRE